MFFEGFLKVRLITIFSFGITWISLSTVAALGGMRLTLATSDDQKAPVLVRVERVDRVLAVAIAAIQGEDEIGRLLLHRTA